jgi:hypothetical protein
MLLIACSANAATKRVSHERCAFAFDHPDSWTVVENPDAAVMDPDIYPQRVADCAVGLRPPRWRAEMKGSPLRLQPYPVRIVYWNRSFAESARRSCFIRVRDLDAAGGRPSVLREMKPWDWAIWVRQGFDVTRQFTTECCQGVRGTTWGHWEAKDGSKASISSECAVVNDRHRHSVVVYSDDDERFKSVVDQIVESVTFGR